MRLPSPALVFVASAIVAAGVVGLVAARKAEGAAAEEAVPLPSDAALFGFAVRGHASGVPLLAATRPFEIALANGHVKGAAPSADRLASGAAFVTRELGRYPAPFLRRIRLAGVVLAQGLEEGEMPIPSLPNVGGLLLIDVASVERDLVHSLHHEVFHFFDIADDGRVAPDAPWEALNAPGFGYGSGGRTLRGAWAATPTAYLPGFVTAYGTSGVEEDKADLFAFAAGRPALVRERSAADPLLRAKLAELTRRLRTLDASAPRMLGLDAL